jgi:putative PIN family toxin of toxin-antitoxin system
LRAVLDVNVLISALLSPTGTPARVVAGWQQGHFDLIVSPQLLAELERALAYPKLHLHIAADEAAEFVDLLLRGAMVERDPAEPPEIRSADAGDDYLIALAAASGAVLVSGDDHLLSLGIDLPIYSPARFVELIAASEP